MINNERTMRLMNLIIHLVGHTHCTGYVVSTTSNKDRHDEVRAITCLVCAQTSFNPTDIEQKYCGHCQRFHEAAR